MKKPIAIVLIVLILAAFIYMIFQHNKTATDIAVDTVEVVATDAENAHALKVEDIDEKALALEEMRQNAGKSGLSREYIVKCSACHGKDGKGPIGPSIAGKDADKNYELLLKYKNKQVANTMMAGMLENTSEADLRMLANEISTFK